MKVVNTPEVCRVYLFVELLDLPVVVVVALRGVNSLHDGEWGCHTVDPLHWDYVDLLDE
jgi:hypothetical protein